MPAISEPSVDHLPEPVIRRVLRMLTPSLTIVSTTMIATSTTSTKPKLLMTASLRAFLSLCGPAAISYLSPRRYGARMISARPDVLVIGAGVSGLSTALALLETGLRVEVYAADPPRRTTSAAAGALWGVHLVGADDRIGPWAATTLARFRELAARADP